MRKEEIGAEEKGREENKGDEKGRDGSRREDMR
jgi:hypothetical protein